MQAQRTDLQPNYTALIQQVHDPLACATLLRELTPLLTATQRAKLYLAVGQAALAQGDAALAADVWAAGAAAGVRSEALLVRQVTTYRWTGRPQLALEALEAWQEHSALPHGLRDLPLQLNRELNRPAKALDILLGDISAAKMSLRQAELAYELATQAGQVTRVLPVLQAYLPTQPAGRATVVELATRKVSADAGWQKLAKKCALNLEWHGQPLEAFRWYQKLAVLGDADALQRLLALNPGLNLDGEVLPVLAAVVPVPAHPELLLSLAQMEADAGEYAAAETHFAMWMQDHPTDMLALKQRAAVAAEQSRLEDALALYQQALKLDPRDQTALKESADLYIALGSFREALQIYQRLPDAAHDHLTLESYALLAESLADYPAYNVALVKRMQRLKQPTTQDFLELGRSYAVIGEQEDQVNTYQTGLRRIPRSHILRIELAHALRLMDRYAEALTVLGRPELRTDMQAMQLYIELACLEEDYTAALSFLGRGIEDKFAFGPEVRLDLGQIYLNNGYAKEADKLLTSVPDEAALWPLLAAARYKAGNFVSAETYQLKYLTALTVPDPQGWLLLGDIYKALGREGDAQDAYAKSLTLMQDKLEDDADADNEPPATPHTKPKAASLR
jgi:tetratricopeptide (TPR) repeat protein